MPLFNDRGNIKAKKFETMESLKVFNHMRCFDKLCINIDIDKRRVVHVTDNWLSTVDSRYLEFQGTLWNTSRYPYFDISELQNWGKNKSNNHI